MVFLATKVIILPWLGSRKEAAMLLTIFYHKGCIKSRFLRSALRMMDWELREADAADPKYQSELIQLKSSAGAGITPIIPAIYTTEAYSHELYPMIEYLNERSPDGMYPADLPTRLFARTLIHRVLRNLSALWPAYQETSDPKPLLAYYDEIEELVADVVRNRDSWRVLEGRPTFLEMLFFAVLVEIAKHRPMTNKTIAPWYKELASDPRLQSLVLEADQ